MRDPTSRRYRRPVLEWAALCVALLLVAAVIAVWRWRDYVAAGAESGARLQSQAHGLGDHLGLLLLAVGRTMKRVQADPLADPGPAAGGALSARLAELNDATAAIESLRMVDHDGKVVASSPDRVPGASMADAPCFQRARARPDPALLYVCAPARTAAGGWSFSVLQPITGAPGRLDAAVVAGLDRGYLGAMLPSALHAADMRAFLFDADGVVIVSAPADALAAGTDLGKRPDSLFNRFRALGQADAAIDGNGSAESSGRLVAYHSVAPAAARLDRPLVVALSRDDAAIHWPWLLTTELFGALWLLKAGASVAVLRVVHRRRDALENQAELTRRQRIDELERIELVVSGAHLSLWVWHVAEDRMDIDAHWCAMVGCPADDLARAAATWRDRIHPDDWPGMRAVMARQVAGGAAVEQFEYRMRHDAGHWIWVLTRGKVVAWDASGHALRLAGTHQDITERKQAEEALRRSEESLVTTLQSIRDAVIATDAQGRVARINPTAERLTGWTAGCAIGRPLAEVFRIDGDTMGESVTDPARQLLTRGDAVKLPDGGTLIAREGSTPNARGGSTLIARDGTRRQIADSVAPIRDASGAITGVVLVFSDVTEAHRVQQALRDSEAQLRLVTNAMPGTVGRYDLQRRIVFANEVHRQWVGLAPEELIGRTLAEVYGAEHIKALEPYIQRVEAGEQLTFESRFAQPTHGPTRRLVTLSPDRDPDGAVRGHFAIVIDLTALRKAEEERHALEEQLRESQKMDSIGTLAGGIAHDFNNVLGAIIGNAELAQQELGDEHPARASLRQISRASQRARGLVRQILTFSRRQPEQLVNQALQPLIEETADLLRSTLPARVELTTDITDVPLYVNADATQIQQVLMNLGTNAWHALRGSTGRVAVGLEGVMLGDGDGDGDGDGESPVVADLPAGQYAHLWVRDDGVGMDAATRQRIFEPFYTTKPVGQGTGLGLSVVHGIVKTHLGAITVDTAPGRGTTFHVYLPATQRSSQVSALDDAETRAMRGRGQHVLYVDDDEVMALMVERLLDRAGYRVTSRPGAKQALAAFVDDPRGFDLVVSDFNMPGFSGLELAAELARIRPDLPLVISSGHISDELRAGAARAGIRYLLQKQNTFEELAAIVERALAEAEMDRQSVF